MCSSSPIPASAVRSARRFCISPSKPASTITRRSSLYCGAERPHRKQWPPPSWNVPDRPEAAMTAVLLIGAGRMGGALIKGWLAAKSFSAIHVVEPQAAEPVRALAGTGAIKLHRSFDGPGLPALDAVVLALKPQVLKGETALLEALG